MKKNKFITFIILTLFITTMVFGFAVSNVVGATGEYTTGFEDGTIDEPYSNDFMSCADIEDNFELNNYKVRSGLNSFMVLTAGHWNLSIDIDTGDSFEVWNHYEQVGGGNRWGWMWFYDSSQVTNGQSPLSASSDFYVYDDAIIEFHYQINAPGTGVFYKDHNGVEQLLDTGINTGEFVLNFFKINATDEIWYKYEDNNVTGTPRNITALADGYTIDTVFFYMYPDVRYNYDDLEIIGGGSGGGSGGDVSGYDSIGDIFDSGITGSWNERYIEEQYNIPIDTTVKALDLLVSNNQHGEDDDLTNYWCQINGNSIGNPDFWIPYTPTSYILRWWDIDLEIDDETVVMEWYHDYTPTTIYWYVKLTGNDNDNDNNVQYAHHNSPSLYDGVYNGLWYNGYEPIYALYYEGSTTPPPGYAEDFISINEGLHYIYENVFITYTTSTLIYDNYITIYNRDTGAEVGQTQGFPLKVNQWTDTIGWIPYDSGNYSVNLYREGENKSSYDFYVYTNLTGFNVWAYPNPVTQGNIYTIAYVYNHGEGKDGAIFVGETNNFNDGVKVAEFSDGDSGAFLYQKTDVSPIYISLCTEITSGNYGLVDQYILYVKLTSCYTYIDALIDSLELIEGQQKNQVIVGQHCNVGANVYVTLDSTKIKYVGDSTSFEFTTPIHKNGLYNVSLWMTTANGTIWLAGDTFTAGGLGEPQEEPILPNIDKKIGALIGIILTIVLTLLPILIQVGFKVDIEVPALVYGAFGCFGIILSVYLGFFDIWVIVFIIAVLLLFSVIQFFQNR